jgi:hypothetical protein
VNGPRIAPPSPARQTLAKAIEEAVAAERALDIARRAVERAADKVKKLVGKLDDANDALEKVRST